MVHYQMFYNERGGRLWLPIIAGAAIISAPFWLNGRQCCGNQQGLYGNQQPYPQYQYNYTYPTTGYPYPYPYPYP